MNRSIVASKNSAARALPRHPSTLPKDDHEAPPPRLQRSRPLSVSRQLSAEIVSRQRALHPNIEVIYRDLAADPLLHLSAAHMAVWQGSSSEDSILTADVQKGNDYLEELIGSEILVIGTPMYNLTIPTPLKAWIDRVALAGKTFRYTAAGPEGLLRQKKAFIASSRGGVYSVGTPAARLEHQETYLIGLLAFLGVTDVTVVRAEGIAFGPEARKAAVDQALEQISTLSA